MEKNLETSKNFNKYAYIAFVVAGIVFLIMREWSNVIIFIGLALAFDPFNPKLPFSKRPGWQKAILVGHVLIVLMALLLDIF